MAAGRQSAGQLTGGAGSPHLVDGHVRSSLSLLGHHLGHNVLVIVNGGCGHGADGGDGR